MVFLDVVYNHFGPAGNYLTPMPGRSSPSATRRPGAPASISTAGRRPVRDFFVHNALYWLEEYHSDGLRLDAVHAILDDSSAHILAEIAARARERSRPRGSPRPGKRRQPGAMAAAARGPAEAPHRAVERRPASCLAHPPDRRGGRLLCGLCRPARGAPRALPTQGFAYQGEPSAIAAARPAANPPPPAARGLRGVPAEPRPGRQPRLRRAALARWPPRSAWRSPGRPPAVAADPDSVHGRGMGGLDPVPVLRRFFRRSRRFRGGARGPAGRIRASRPSAGARPIPDPTPEDTFPAPASTGPTSRPPHSERPRRDATPPRAPRDRVVPLTKSRFLEAPGARRTRLLDVTWRYGAVRCASSPIPAMRAHEPRPAESGAMIWMSPDVTARATASTCRPGPALFFREAAR